MKFINKWFPVFFGIFIAGIVLLLFIKASDTEAHKYLFIIPVLIVYYVHFLYSWNKDV